MLTGLRACLFVASAVVLAAGGCTIVATSPGQGAADAGAWDGSSSSGSGGSSGGGFVDASACEPANVATYQAGSYHPASGAYQGLCVPDANGDPIAMFYEECLGPNADTDQCNDFRTEYATCVGCLLTPDSAAKYGPVIDHSTFVTANVAGCIELASDEEPDAGGVGLSCAVAVQALAGCELAACEANCAVHDTASLASYESCATESADDGCQPFAAAASCAQADEDAGPLPSACLADFATFYATVAPHFCGAAPDAGAVGSPEGGAKPTGDAAPE